MSKDAQEKRVLIVDDDEAITIPFQKVLQNSGFSVDTVSTGQQTLEITEKSVYHLIILDINLPDMKGYEVAKTVREKDNDINLIIITGYPDLADAIDALDLGIDDILYKPIGIDEMKQVTERVLNSKGKCSKTVDVNQFSSSFDQIQSNNKK
jgi:DNA-binding response OmpR family regulator